MIKMYEKVPNWNTNAVGKVSARKGFGPIKDKGEQYNIDENENQFGLRMSHTTNTRNTQPFRPINDIKK